MSKKTSITERLFSHDGAYGESMVGTRGDFRRELADAWPVWHSEAVQGEDFEGTLDEFIEDSLDEHLLDPPTYTASHPFLTPRENQGQTVDVSYSIDPDAEVVLECVYDQNDGSLEYFAYDFPADDDGEWNPSQSVPKLGRRLGRCAVVV